MEVLGIMVKFMKILLPVMNTYESAEAVKRAVETAGRENGSVKLVRVISPGEIRAYKRNSRLWQLSDGSILDRGSYLMDGEEAERKMVMRAFGMIDSIIAGLNCEDIKMEPEVLIGNPAAEIIKTAKLENAGLIVMSMKRRGMLSKLFHSTIRKVASKAPCPVLVVQPDE